MLLKTEKPKAQQKTERMICIESMNIAAYDLANVCAREMTPYWCPFSFVEKMNCKRDCCIHAPNLFSEKFITFAKIDLNYERI
mmetsp:Transcript_29447/g.43835  ORF Transcript_29447/g.43835 Transcript_29447/m.43835 type:complete len:83 (+) Transcript_29447:677-925(+)